MRRTLDEIMTHHESDKRSGLHGYCEHYESFFEPIRDEKLILIELGIGGEDTQLGGASLLAWSEYFPKAHVVGIDIYDKSELNGGRISTYICSQNDEKGLMSVIRQVGAPNIIIDDASHVNSLTIESFKILFSELVPGGIYAIEDLSCSYRWDFGGNTDLKNMHLQTTMNYLFSMLHNLNPVRLGNADYKDIPEFADIKSVHFYPDLVIIKKS